MHILVASNFSGFCRKICKVILPPVTNTNWIVNTQFLAKNFAKIGLYALSSDTLSKGLTFDWQVKIFFTGKNVLYVSDFEW